MYSSTFQQGVWRFMRHRHLRKLIFMNGVLFFLLLFSFQLFASGTVAQRVSLDVKDAKVEDVLKEIERQTGLYFFFFGSDLSGNKPVTVQCKDWDLKDVLQVIQKDQPFELAVEGETIVLRKTKVLPGIVGLVMDTAITVTGRVVSAETGESLPGVTVLRKDVGSGTVTNARGEFVVRNIAPNAVLVFRYVGYKSKEVRATGTTSVVIPLEIATIELDKTVIQGYGKTTKRYNTGNIATVTAEEIERQPVMNPLQALQGKVPGLVVTQTTGYATSPFKVELRGRSVINQDLPSEPLYIVDGVPLTALNLGGANYASGSIGFVPTDIIGPDQGFSPFFNINPADIESITVLKDADAIAIYGSQGGNGVIVITTKKGRPEKTKFGASVNMGQRWVSRYYEMLNTQQYLEVRREAFKNDNIEPTPGNAADLLVWDTTRYTDLQKLFWGDVAKTTDVQVSLSGGDRVTTFRISGNYQRETAFNTITGSNQRGGTQFNLSHRNLSQKLLVEFTGMYSATKSDMIALGGSVTLPPNIPAIFNDKGELNYLGWAPEYFPFGYLLQPYTVKSNFLNSRLNIGYEILKGLSMSVSMGYSNNQTTNKKIEPIISKNPMEIPTGSSSFGSNSGIRTIIEPQLDYKRIIGKGEFSILVGGTYRNVTQGTTGMYGSGYVNDDLLNSISNAPNRSASDRFGEYRYSAAFGRINYNWDKKYVVNFSGRRDGSSKFGPGKQFGNFGATGIAWIMSEENFFKKIPAISFGKIRASYGHTGSDLVGDYKYLTRWSQSVPPYYEGVPTYIPTQHANPNFQWQVDKKLEVALSLGLIKDRILIDMVWYRNRIGKQLIDYFLPGITGFTTVTANFPATIQNTGFEPSISARIITKKDLSLLITANFGVNRNVLLSFPNIETSPYASTYIVGKPLNIDKKLHYIGVDPQTGDYSFEDKNKDGVITYYPFNDLSDKQIIDYSVSGDGGLSSDLRYKNWQLNLFFQLRKQRGRSAFYSSGMTGGERNLPIEALNRWQKPGDIAKYPRYTTLSRPSFILFLNSDGIYSDASFIRLNNAALSFDLPSGLLNKAKIRSGKIYLRAQNLFLLTNYDGLDPEAQSFGTMPVLTGFTAGIQFEL